MKEVLSVVSNLDEVYVVFCRCFCVCVWAIFLRFVFFVSWCIWFVLSTILWSFFIEFV